MTRRLRSGNPDSEYETGMQDPPLLQVVDGSIRRSMTSFLKDRRGSTRTFKIYKAELDRLYRFLSGFRVVMMKDIEPDHLRDFIGEMELTHKPGGVHLSFRVMRTFFYWYETETDGAYRSPLRKVKPPKYIPPVIFGATQEEISAMVSACNGVMGKRDKAILLLLYDTGIRANELLTARVMDVDFPFKKLHIFHGKGAKERDVFFGSRTKRALKAYLATHERVYLQGRLFLNDEGDNLVYDALKLILRRRGHDAGLENPPTPHDFRRAFVVTCIRNGMDLITLKRLTGHTSLKTLERYAALVLDDLHDAHERASPVDRL